MIFRRQWIVMMVVGGCVALDLPGQDTPEPTETPATPTVPLTPPSEPTTPTTPPPTPPTSGAASSFPTTPPPSETGPLGATGGGEPAESTPSSQGLGFGTPKVPDAAPSFTLPGFYGSSPTSYTAGQGRLARPRFRYTANLSVGYDDNVLQSPTTPGPEQIVLIEPGTPDTAEPIFETRTTRGAGGVQIPTQVVVGVRTVKGKLPKFQTIPPLKRTGSFFTRGALAMDMQLFSPRSLFTLDANINADHYYSRPGSKSTDYTGSLSFSYVYRFNPRTQVTAQFDAAYLTQPDFSRPNTPETFGIGAFITASARLDLSHRWTPRVTSLLSFSDNALLFQEKSQQGGDYNQTLFGTEFRYLWSPRFTVLGELRYGTTTYDQNPILDSHSIYVLLGGEFRLSQRISGSVRVGNATRTFEKAGESASTPYAETSLAYRFAPASVLNWNTRFGFEEPLSPGEERVVWRSGLSFLQVFSSRLSGVAAINYLHETSTSPGIDITFTSDTIDGTLRFEYAVTKHFSLSATYGYTQRLTSTEVVDYYRNRFFFGGQYNF